MGGIISKPKSPPPPPPPKEIPTKVPEAPTPVDDSTIEARNKRRRRAAGNAGYKGTLLSGDIGTATTSKTILGN